MKVFRLINIVFGVCAFLPVAAMAADPVPTEPAAPTTPALSSPAAAEVLKLSRADVGDDVLLAFINSSQKPYNLSATDIASLKNAGLSAPILEAMLKHDGTLSTTAAANQQQPPAVIQRPPPSQIISAGPATPRPSYSTSVPAPVPFQGETIAKTQPPPSRMEPVDSAPPGDDYVWTSGYWSWQKKAWVWVKGSWVVRPQPGAVWVSGYWLAKDKTWTWVPGEWKVGSQTTSAY